VPRSPMMLLRPTTDSVVARTTRARPSVQSPGLARSRWTTTITRSACEVLGFGVELRESTVAPQTLQFMWWPLPIQLGSILRLAMPLVDHLVPAPRMCSDEIQEAAQESPASRRNRLGPLSKEGIRGQKVAYVVQSGSSST
jgi:hypothetical protein